MRNIIILSSAVVVAAVAASLVGVGAAVGVGVEASKSTNRNVIRRMTKHPLEDTKSWQLHLDRLEGNESEEDQRRRQNQRRRLSSQDDDSTGADGGGGSGNDDDTPYTIQHKKPKKNIPFPGGETTHGMMIDAGSVRCTFDVFSCLFVCLFV
jgi:hypothetical protein